MCQVIWLITFSNEDIDKRFLEAVDTFTINIPTYHDGIDNMILMIALILF